MAQHYKVMIACWGRYQQGSVIPEAAIRARGGDPDGLVARGVIRPTTEARNCDLVGGDPGAKKPDAGALSAEVIRESNELRRANTALSADNQILREQVEGKERARKALEKELAEQVEEIDHLTTACETHQANEQTALAKVAELEARVKALEDDNAKLLEEATAPKKDAKLAPLV